MKYDILLVHETRDRVHTKLEMWRQLLVSKGVKLSWSTALVYGLWNVILTRMIIVVKLDKEFSLSECSYFLVSWIKFTQRRY